MPFKQAGPSPSRQLLQQIGKLLKLGQKLCWCDTAPPIAARHNSSIEFRYFNQDGGHSVKICLSCGHPMLVGVSRSNLNRGQGTGVAQSVRRSVELLSTKPLAIARPGNSNDQASNNLARSSNQDAPARGRVHAKPSALHGLGKMGARAVAWLDLAAGTVSRHAGPAGKFRLRRARRAAFCSFFGLEFSNGCAKKWLGARSLSVSMLI